MAAMLLVADRNATAAALLAMWALRDEAIRTLDRLDVEAVYSAWLATVSK